MPSKQTIILLKQWLVSHTHTHITTEMIRHLMLLVTPSVLIFVVLYLLCWYFIHGNVPQWTCIVTGSSPFQLMAIIFIQLSLCGWIFFSLAITVAVVDGKAKFVGLKDFACNNSKWNCQMADKSKNNNNFFFFGFVWIHTRMKILPNKIRLCIVIAMKIKRKCQRWNAIWVAEWLL